MLIALIGVITIRGPLPPRVTGSRGKTADIFSTHTHTVPKQLIYSLYTHTVPTLI